MTIAIALAMSAQISDRRVATRVLKKMSRPSSSVPNQCAPLGGAQAAHVDGRGLICSTASGAMIARMISPSSRTLATAPVTEEKTVRN